MKSDLINSVNYFKTDSSVQYINYPEIKTSKTSQSRPISVAKFPSRKYFNYLYLFSCIQEVNH